MNILCPGCHTSLNVPEQSMRLVCDHCGIETDISKIGTFPGMATAPLVRDMTGATVGPYEILELVGVGGMGIVYKARHRKDRQTVALKILNYDYLLKKEFISRFEREAQTLQKLDHPNIIKVIDSGRQKDTYYIVTEYLEGLNLSQYLRAQHSLRTHRPGIKKIIRIMVQICTAIHYAHQKGVVHRDLKPANIFIANDSVKVLDFGLARLTGSDSKLSMLTRSDLVMGTINYLSPEQRTDAKSVDLRSDIFSLGVIFYEMVTGNLPMGRFRLPSRINRGLSKICDRIVKKCLQAVPAKRYPSAHDIIKELRRMDRIALVKKRLAVAFAAALLVMLSVLVLNNIYSMFKKERTGKPPVVTRVTHQKSLLKSGLPASGIPAPDTLPHEIKPVHLPTRLASPKTMSLDAKEISRKKKLLIKK